MIGARVRARYDRYAPPTGDEARWLAMVAGATAVGALVYTVSAYQVSPAVFPLALVGLGFVCAALAYPPLGVAGALLLLPAETLRLKLPLGSLTPPEAILLLVALGWAARALVAPDTVALPRLRDTSILFLLLLIALGVSVAVDGKVVLRIFVVWTGFYFVYLQAQTFTPKEMRLVLAALVIGAGVVGVEGAVRYISSGEFGLVQGTDQTLGRAVGSLADANYFAALLVLGLLPGIALVVGDVRRNAWLMPALVGAVVGLALSLSRGGMSGFAVGLLLLLLWRRWRWVVGGVVLLFVVFTAANANPIVKSDQFGIVTKRLSSLGSEKTEATTNRRPQIWHTALDVASEHPFIGVGVNQFIYQAARRDLFERGGPLENAHSIPLSLAAETGLAGLIAFLWFICQLAGRARRALRASSTLRYTLAIGLAAALLGFLIQGLTVVQLRVQIVAGIFFVFAGMLTGLADQADGAPVRSSSVTPADR
jgi:putative inorganic carbon (hco3(-)) transporter